MRALKVVFEGELAPAAASQVLAEQHAARAAAAAVVALAATAAAADEFLVVTDDEMPVACAWGAAALPLAWREVIPPGSESPANQHPAALRVLKPLALFPENPLTARLASSQESKTPVLKPRLTA